ncbi:MAG: hypothetical protein SPI91_01095 [Bacilli bacterium]|nr:hypothetical protein [Bacilli bacterium]
MKKNNKGFVLAEAIIVSVFVLGMFTYLAMNVIPLISRYERVVNYDNPQEIYLANTLYEEMLNVEGTNNIKKYINLSVLLEEDDVSNENKSKLTCDRDDRETPNVECTGSDGFYEELGKALKIEAIYTYDTGKDCGDIENDKGLKNYCEYYIKRKIGEEKNITKAFMIKFSGDKENNSNKDVNKKYATIVVTTE